MAAGGYAPQKNVIACNNYTLRKATRNISQLFDDVLAPSGLRASQHSLLYGAKLMGWPTIKNLATAAVMDLSALGHTLKPLVRDGYIVLIVNEKDRRSKRIVLTSKGETKLQETTELWRRAQSCFETALGSDKSADLRGLMEVLASDGFGAAFTNAASPPA